MNRDLILVINPGSTSTKLAIYRENQLEKIKSIDHSLEDLSKFEDISGQFDYRLELIENWLEDEKIDLKHLRGAVARGGMLRPIPGGVYRVSHKMLEDLDQSVGGQHASNLGAGLADRLAKKAGVKAYIVDPVAVDELEDIARLSGLDLIERRSSSHALNIKAVSHKRAEELDKDIRDLNFIVAHLGGGISICPVKSGRIVDVNNANEMGPFSPERTGTLPVGSLVDLCYSNKYTYQEIKKMLRGHGGLMSYLNTNDGRQIEKKIEDGDDYAKLVYDAMIYQISKEIVGMATVLRGKVDNIILTGGLSYSKYLLDGILSHVGFLGPVVVYPGEDEMEALNRGLLRVLNKEELAKNYDEVIVDD